MFQAALTSRALGMHQRVIVTEDSEELTPPPTRGNRTTLRDIIEAREAVTVVTEEKKQRGTVKPGSAKPGSGKPGQYASKGKFSMAEMIEAATKARCTGDEDCGCGCR